jgi:hypothetical protein
MTIYTLLCTFDFTGGYYPVRGPTGKGHKRCSIMTLVVSMILIYLYLLRKNFRCLHMILLMMT